MKKGFITKTVIFMAIIFCYLSFTDKKEVSAAVGFTVPLQQVDDVDNYPFPTTTTISYAGYDYRSFTMFTIDSPGQIKALFRCPATAKSTGNVWISRDTYGLDVVGRVNKFSGSETLLSWFLESGTYYINSTWTDSYSQINFALLYEPSGTEETKAVTGFNNSNSIKLEETVRGFLSATVPNDYYSFVLEEKANVTIEYSFNTSGAADSDLGYCTLYDANDLHLSEGTYAKSDKGTKKLVRLLEPGTYTVKLFGLNGNTTISVKPMFYNVDFVVSSDEAWTDEPVDVDIETSIDYSEILVQYKDVEESVIANSDVWTTVNETNVKLDGEAFVAEKSGVYSVRIADKYGNYTLEKLEIKNIDVTKPKVTGVTNNKSYKKAVTLKWTDKQSGIDTAKTTLNGKAVASGVTLSKEGKYTLKVYDLIGNLRTVVFYIDYTAPTAGVENGKTYTDSVSLKFLDNLSGIKKLLVDELEQSAETRTMRCYSDGTYTIKLWDNAGNYRKITFTIKKAY